MIVLILIAWRGRALKVLSRVLKVVWRVNKLIKNSVKDICKKIFQRIIIKTSIHQL